MPLLVTVSAQGKVFGVNIGTVLRCNYNLDLFMFVHISYVLQSRKYMTILPVSRRKANVYFHHNIIILIVEVQ